jgi:hypothetical protein
MTNGEQDDRGWGGQASEALTEAMDRPLRLGEDKPLYLSPRQGSPTMDGLCQEVGRGQASEALTEALLSSLCCTQVRY